MTEITPEKATSAKGTASATPVEAKTENVSTGSSAPAHSPFDLKNLYEQYAVVQNKPLSNGSLPAFAVSERASAAPDKGNDSRVVPYPDGTKMTFGFKDGQLSDITDRSGHTFTRQFGGDSNGMPHYTQFIPLGGSSRANMTSDHKYVAYYGFQSGDNWLFVIDAKARKMVWKSSEAPAWMSFVGGQFALRGSADRELRLYDVKSGELEWKGAGDFLL